MDTKIEEIFKAAQVEITDSTSSPMTNEFLEQLIELAEDLCWLAVEIPVNCHGKHLLKKYENGFKEIIGILRGLERIWRSIRLGFGGIPRNRDYSTEHTFKSLQTSPLLDTRNQWDSHNTEIKESIDAIQRNSSTTESSDTKFKGKCKRIIGAVYAIFKKIRLTLLSENLDFITCDTILDESDQIILIVKESCRLLMINPRSNHQICDQIFEINRRVHDLILFCKLDDEKWFKDHLLFIDAICEELSEMNPIR